jgi:hypothetical protein
MNSAGHQERKLRLILLSILTVCFYSCTNTTKPLSSSECIVCDRLSLLESINPEVAGKYWPTFNSESLTPPLIYFDDSTSWMAFSAENIYSNFIQAEKVICPTGLLLYKMNKRIDRIPFHMENKMSFSDSTSVNFYKPILFCSDVVTTLKMVPDINYTEDLSIFTESIKGTPGLLIKTI